MKAVFVVDFLLEITVQLNVEAYLVHENLAKDMIAAWCEMLGRD